MMTCGHVEAVGLPGGDVQLAKEMRNSRETGLWRRPQHGTGR